MNIHEEMFARHFVKPAKRERYLSLLESPKGRKKIIFGLDHCPDLDLRYATLLATQDQNLELIYDLLKRKGATDVCYVMSTNEQYDGRELPLFEALEQTFGSGNGTFISCLPGKLAYYEFEDAGERYLLER